MKALYLRLDHLTFPAGPSDGVRVFIGQPTPEPLEYVAVNLALPSPAEQAQRTSTRRNEEFVLRVIVQTDAHHRESLDALDRLAAICAEVEASLRDQDTGAPIPLVEVPDIGVDVVLNRATSLSIDPKVYGLPSGGWGAQAVIDIPFAAVI